MTSFKTSFRCENLISQPVQYATIFTSELQFSHNSGLKNENRSDSFLLKLQFFKNLSKVPERSITMEAEDFNIDGSFFYLKFAFSGHLKQVRIDL